MALILLDSLSLWLDILVISSLKSEDLEHTTYTSKVMKVSVHPLKFRVNCFSLVSLTRLNRL